MASSNIIAIIKSIGPNKLLALNELPIKMRKLRGKSVFYCLKRIMEVSVQEVFSLITRESSCRKGSENFLKHLQAKLVFPSDFGKIFNRVITKDLFDYFHQNELFS